MSSRRTLRSRAMRSSPPSTVSNATPRNTRLTRAVASASVTVSRSPSDSPEESKPSLRLTVKMPSSKLREVTSGNNSRGSASTRRTVNVFAETPIMSGPRNSRSKRKIVEYDSDEEEEQEEDEDEDATGDEDADVDADGDVDMDDQPPQPPVSKRHAKSAATSAAAPSKPVKSVEAKEMELDDDDDDDDEELSELDSDAEGEPDDEEPSAAPDDMADANGEEEELDEEDEEDEENELDSDDGTPATGSRAGTPDLSRMTKRQRGNLGNDFLQLPMEPQIKKHLTAEERAMRRAEMARRRKNLSEKRNEEEKMDTINRLLRKQAPKRRGRVPAAEAADATPGLQEAQESQKPDPTMTRWISNREGCRVGVPEEWLGTPAGHIFVQGPRKLVEEV